MKRLLFIEIIFLICSISVFGQTKKKWQEVRSIGTISAYSDFIKKHPKSKFTAIANQAIEFSENGIIDEYCVNLAMFLLSYPNPVCDELGLVKKFSPIIRILSDSACIEQFGEITSITTNCGKKIQGYGQRGSSIPFTKVMGTSFSCEIILEKLAAPLFGSWSSEFPSEIVWHKSYVDNPVNPIEILNLIVDRIPSNVFLKVATKDQNYQYSNIILDTLRNQSHIGRIALENKNAEIRNLAIEKLLEQPILEKIALIDDESKNRYSAVLKLTNVSFLEKIKNEDKNNIIRNVAAYRLNYLQTGKLDSKFLYYFSY